MSTTPMTTSTAPRSAFARNLWIGAGAVALAAGGLAAGLALRPAPAPQLPAAEANALLVPQASPAASEAVAAASAPADLPIAVAAVPKAPTKTRPPANKAPVAKATPAAPAEVVQASAAPTPVVPVATQPAVVCADCGVIEAVQEVSVKGKGSGLGAVAGGVLGGAVGNQMGKGDGRTAMTVLGAIGGGLAGHEIEKRARSEKVYKVSVRMDDGSLRTVKQTTPPAVGVRVTVEGKTLRITRSSGTGSGEGQLIKTSGSTGN
jgi:outer membrane lipoprotein SlyB